MKRALLRYASSAPGETEAGLWEATEPMDNPVKDFSKKENI